MIQWYVVRASMALLRPDAAREVMGLTMMFNGALGLAEIMAPRPEQAIAIGMDEDKRLMTEMHICFECWTRKPVVLAELVERLDRDQEIAREAVEQLAAENE